MRPDHEAVAAGLARDPADGQAERRAVGLDPLGDAALRPGGRRDVDQLGEQAARRADRLSPTERVAQPAFTSDQARVQVWKFAGWTSAIASAIALVSAVARNAGGTSPSAAGLTIANPFWAITACAGRETK